MKQILFILTFIFIFSGVFAQENKGKLVIFNTDLGDITILLYDETPLHQANFIKLAEEGFYDNQLFHRVMNNFMIQAGDPNSIGAAKDEMLGMSGPKYTIPAEFKENLFHKKGALAAARKEDAFNPTKASSGSQFYIVQGQVFSEQQLDAFVRMGKHKKFTAEQIAVYTSIGGSPHLDNSYTVFGEVISGLEVIDKIASVEVDAYNRPLEDVSFRVKVVK